jgi:hypothetical protein
VTAAVRARSGVAAVLERTDIRFDDEPDIVDVLPRRRTRIRLALTSPSRRLLAWWDGLVPAERLMWRGLVLLSGGLAMVAIPLALIVPGAVLTATALGFSFSRAARSTDG